MRFCKSLILVVAIIIATDAYSQSFIFGPRLGPSLSLQQWNGVQRDVLFAGHVAFYIESHEEDSPSSLYAQIGYHQRGSAERNLLFNINSGDVFRSTQKYKFNNISLHLGAKNILKMDVKAKPFYTLGIRAEYTVNTNLDRFQGTPYELYFPNNFFVNKFNYGFSAGGGFQYQFSDLIGGTIELVISPDISKQYEQRAIPNVIDPRNIGSNRTLPEQNVRNLTLEISASLRLLRKVEYY